MQQTQIPDRTHWDPFNLKVQQNLVEPLGLDNVVIIVGRHQGRNEKVKVYVSYPVHLKDSATRVSIHDDLVIARKQLTVDQLHQEIKATLDTLLENCTVKFGRIKLKVNQGVLKETRFSVATRPHESTAKFFKINL